ncbi:MAG: hypothetical protein IJK18_04855 [Clostridia bacterium]|nr:hypothetical protein [Clostridia bacterium]
MKKIGFIGATDKTDLIVYVAKVLEQIGKKVIVVDTTIMQKTKYVVPSIDPTKSYITDFDNVDYAIGFENIQDMIRYLGIREINDIDNLDYDYMLIDIDKETMIDNFGIEEAEKNFFVTAFDIYSLKRGVEILNNLTTNLQLSKILINYDMKKEDEEYLNYLSIDTKTIWDEFTIYVPRLDENQIQIEDNQRIYKARIKKLVPEYQESILYIVQNIVGDISVNKLRKIIKE